MNRPSEGPRSIRGTHGGGGGPLLPDMSNSSNEHWRPHSASFSEGQIRSRTPIEATNAAAKSNWPRNISGSFTSLNNMETSECDNNFQPVNTLLRSNSNNSSNHSPGPVDLLVTNLDQSLDPQDLKTLLLSIFQEHSMVCNYKVLSFICPYVSILFVLGC